MLKRVICLIAIFSAYQFLQMNTYSNEYVNIHFHKHELNNTPFFIKVENDLLGSYIISPFYYKLALERKTLNPPERVYSRGVLNAFCLANFLKSNNAKISNSDALKMASEYIKQCEIEGVNHDIAFAQMCLETGFLKFGGSVLPSQNNFCGLGAVTKNCKGESFISKEIGVLAHVQHLKAYVSTDKLNSPIVDTRFKYVKRGSVATIYDLAGKWAADPKYGDKIENLLLRMYSI